MKNCSFLNNIGNGDFGGAIEVKATRFILENSEFLNNTSVQMGSILVQDSLTNMTFVDFYNNSYGAIYLLSNYYGNYFQASNLYLASNNAINSGQESGTFGGAIYITGTTNFTIKDSVFVENSAGRGSAIFGTSESGFSNVLVYNCSFVSNMAQGHAGALYLNGYFNLNVKDTSFLGNYAKFDNNGSCGALHANGIGWMHEKAFEELDMMPDSLVTRSEIQMKFGVEGVSKGNQWPSLVLILENVIFEGNYANIDNGALYIKNGVLADLSKCTFSGNKANFNTGSILVSDSELYCNKCTFIDNKSSNTAGAIYIEVS